MRGAIRIGRIFGIPIGVNPSWFLILLLIVYSLATQAFPQVFKDQPAWAQWALALLTALVFFASMVLHELGHSLMARLFGIPVRSITLFVLGAVAQTTRETRRPGHEFLMAAAGPAVSLLIAGVFMVGWLLTGMGDTAVSRVCEWLWLMNFFVGIFNLIPAYPMDGGRVLRSILWGLSGNWRRATHWAALTGRGFAYTLIGLGVLAALQVDFIAGAFGPFSGIQFILLGLFLNVAARQSDAQSAMLEHLSHHQVSDIMVRDIPATVATTSVQEALTGPLAGYGAGREWLLVSSGDRFSGLAARSVLQSLPEERQAITPVGDLTIPSARLRATRPDEPLDDLFQRMDQESTPVFVVVEQGQVEGIVHQGQLLRLARGAHGG